MISTLHVGLTSSGFDVSCVCVLTMNEKKCRQSYISQITIRLSSKCPTLFFVNFLNTANEDHVTIVDSMRL